MGVTECLDNHLALNQLFVSVPIFDSFKRQQRDSSIVYLLTQVFLVLTAPMGTMIIGVRRQLVICSTGLWFGTQNRPRNKRCTRTACDL